MTETTYWAVEPSPIGDLLLVGSEGALVGVHFHPDWHGRSPAVGAGWRRDRGPLAEAADQLAAYFAGDRHTFDLPLAPAGTAFQRQVWDTLRTVPYGETTTYGRLAAAIGRPTSARAVGAANGANPLAVVVPCHRVVGADRTLTGYGGGLDAKRLLLTLEGAVRPAGGQAGTATR